MKPFRKFPHLILFFIFLTGCLPVSGDQIASPEESARELARASLELYFELLRQGSLAEAQRLYGGDYDLLAGYNPGVDSSDEVALFESVCQIFLCLELKNIVSETQISPSEFHYTVEFSREDGTLFERGPCCGASEEEMPPVSQFDFTVVRKDDGPFLVMELPVYVP